MKYVFKYPFENISNKSYTIGHQINLNREQRKKLQKIGGFVDTVGVSIPILGNDQGSEVFCKYKIISGPTSDKAVRMEEFGWSMNLFDQAKLLDDIKDGGVKFLSIVYHDMIEWGGKLYPTLHQIVISDSEDLDKSLYLDHLFQTSSK